MGNNNRFFNPESFAWKPFGVLADLFLLSLLWLLFSLPLITAGAASAALYDAAARGLRQKEANPLSRFFRTFRAELKSGCLAALLLGGLWLLCLLVLRLLISLPLPEQLAFPAEGAALVLLLLAAGPLCWVFPLLSRFRFSVKALCAAAMKLSLAKLPVTLVLSLSLAGSVWLCLRFLLPAFFLPALLALFHSLFLERVFRQYTEREEPSQPEKDA